MLLARYVRLNPTNGLTVQIAQARAAMPVRTPRVTEGRAQRDSIDALTAVVARPANGRAEPAEET